MIDKVEQLPSYSISRCVEDQFGDYWAEVTSGEKSCWISIGEFTDDDTHGFSKLRRIGINALTPQFRNHIKSSLQLAKPDGQILVARRPGYIYASHSGRDLPVAYAYGSGDILRPPKADEPEVIVGFEPIANFGRAGSVKVFQREIGRVSKGQSLPILCLCLSLAPIIQPFTPDGMYVENPIIELSGKTTSFKSAAAIGVGGAIWGGPESQSVRSKLGFFSSANATINAIEKSGGNFNNSLMGIDETTAFAAQKRGRSEALGHFVHRLSLETPKSRYGESAGLPIRTFALLTSNVSFARICEESSEVLEALMTRLVTFHVPDRSTLIFDKIPDGFTSATAAGLHFYTIGMANYGHVARLMIAQTLVAANSDFDGFRQKIGSLMRSIMNDVNFEKLDPPAQRRFKIIALAYAAGFLAKKWNVLNKDDFGAFKKPLLRAWRMSEPSVASDRRERYFAYLEDHHAHIVVVKNKSRLELTDDEFQRKKAYIVKTRDGKILAAFPPRFMKTRFSGFEDDFKMMRELGLARCDENLQAKLRVRKRDGRERQDRLYAFYIDSWPLR